jgi:DNA-binding HxlR family transcriptional regulator
VAHSLDLLGERWALLVVRELLFGPKRFTDLRAGLPGASADMLSQRLRELQDGGIVRRHRTQPPASAWVYELTEWGLELEPIFNHLGRWGSRSPGMRHDAPIGVDSLMLSLKALFDPAAADGFTATVALRLTGQDFQARIAGGRLDVTRGRPDRPDVSLDTDPATLTSVLHDGRPLDAAVRTGDLQLTGDRAVAERVLRLFPLPPPAG